MKSETKETRSLKLDLPVVVRKVPMTKVGCSALRAIREYQIALYNEKNGADVDIPFPTSIHLMMMDYCRLLKLEIKDK
jgi:hypothetical protein